VSRSTTLSRALKLRLESQLEGLPALLVEANEHALRRRPPTGKWSAHEHLAHLGRHHTITLERIERMLRERAPDLGHYSAEADPEWSEWAGASTRELVERLTTLRHELLHRVSQLEPAELAREARHPVFGMLSVPQLLDLFLLHEAHHVYQLLLRVHGA